MKSRDIIILKNVICSVSFYLLLIGSSLGQETLTIKGDIDIKSSASLYVLGDVLGSGAGQITNNGYIYVQEHTSSGTENWENNASTSFLDGSGTVTFVSADEQIIKGTQKTSFYNLTINNSGTGIILDQHSDVTNNLTMTDGDFNLDNYVLDLTTTGIIVGEAESNRIKVGNVLSDTGVVKYTTSVNNVTNFNPANIGVEITTTQNLGTIEIIRGHKRQQGSGSFASNYSVARYVDIPGIGMLDGSAVNLKLSYWDAELDPTDHPVEANLIQYQLVDITDWATLTGTINTVSNLSTPLASTYSAVFSSYNNRFTLGSIETVLPVELSQFDVSCQNDNTELNWSTSSEINNDYFTVERSTDAINFETIGTVNGSGNSSTMHNYFWSDDNPINGTAYYRLKQTDFNGAFEYHEVTAVKCSRGTYISIYPNPFENGFTISLSENTSYPTTVEVMDYLGRKVYTQIIENATTEIILEDKVSPGTYFVKVFNETTQVVERIVKLK
ncbi:MAG: hypothetical protein COB15_06550 [Flavobacteriales bacterium]|nr:MAG: hypothetical protein COB15_06550 [Flavobacteriales bacterium]